MEEQYNGWTNRETWAAALWIGNDLELDEPFRRAAQSEVVTQIRLEDYIKETLEANLFDWENNPNIPEEFLTSGELQKIRNAIRDIGSLWRINYREIAGHYWEEASND
jgi:hypothetical protein